VISSCGNVVDKDQYEKALKMQYPRLHEGERQQPRRQRPTFQHRNPMPHNPRRHQAHLTEDNEIHEDHADDGDEAYNIESTADGEHIPEDSYSLDDEDQDDEAFFQEALAERDLDDLTHEEHQALAAVMQAKRKGRAPTRRPPPSSAPPTTSTSMGGTAQYGFKATGTVTLDEKKRRERRAKIQILKQRTRCNDCQLFGHWAGDDMCKKKKSHSGKEFQKKGSAYFVLSENFGGSTFYVEYNKDQDSYVDVEYNKDQDS